MWACNTLFGLLYTSQDPVLITWFSKFRRESSIMALFCLVHTKTTCPNCSTLTVHIDYSRRYAWDSCFSGSVAKKQEINADAWLIFPYSFFFCPLKTPYHTRIWVTYRVNVPSLLKTLWKLREIPRNILVTSNPVKMNMKINHYSW